MNGIYSSFLLLNKMDLQLTWAGFPTDGSTGAAQAASRTPSGDAAAGGAGAAADGAGAAADGAGAAADGAGAAAVQPASRTPSGDAGWTMMQMCIIHTAIWCLMVWQGLPNNGAMVEGKEKRKSLADSRVGSQGLREGLLHSLNNSLKRCFLTVFYSIFTVLTQK